MKPFATKSGTMIKEKNGQTIVTFPDHFITRSGKINKKSKDLSADGTPRYIPNPNSPSASYSLKDCLECGWTPIYTRIYQKKTNN